MGKFILPFLKSVWSRAVAGSVLCIAVVAGASPALADDWIIGTAQAAIAPATASPNFSRQQAFSIAPQPLTNALDAFVITTGLQLFYSSRLTANKTSPGVSGLLSPDTALRAMLVGTGLKPLETEAGAVTLVLDTPTVSYASASPISAPTLSLDTMHVQAPPTPTQNFRFYATTVQYAVLAALSSNADLREHRYNVDLNVWVGPGGTVQHSQLVNYNGDRGMDNTIMQVVRRVVVTENPPNDLPQPVHVRIHGIRPY